MVLVAVEEAPVVAVGTDVCALLDSTIWYNRIEKLNETVETGEYDLLGSLVRTFCDTSAEFVRTVS
jgi:hypothetical protein